MSVVREEAADTAEGIYDLFARTLAEGRDEVRELACGSSAGWVWVVFRVAPCLGTEAVRFTYGFWIDVEAAHELYAVDPDETVAEMAWMSDIACPQPTPEEMPLNRYETYECRDGVWWRDIPESTVIR